MAPTQTRRQNPTQAIRCSPARSPSGRGKNWRVAKLRRRRYLEAGSGERIAGRYWDDSSGDGWEAANLFAAVSLK